jgi:hypothetical protein
MDLDLAKFIGTAFEGISTAYALRNYFRTMKDYLDPTLLRTKRRIQKRYFEYDIAQDGDMLLWRDLLKDDFNYIDNCSQESAHSLQVGDIVELNNANITRWTPLFPGMKYSREGNIVRQNHLRRFPENHEFGLEEELISRNNAQVLSGSATIRLLPYNKELLLCASGKFCETGIPLIVTERMYSDRIKSIVSEEGSVNGKIVGTLVEMSGEWKDRLHNQTNHIDRNIYGLPRLALIVDQIKQIGTSSQVYASAWTQFINTEQGYSSMIKSFFDPTSLKDIKKSIRILANYKQFLEGDLIGGDWDLDIEFDETRNWFVPGNYEIFDLNNIELFALYYSHYNL